MSGQNSMPLFSSPESIAPPAHFSEDLQYRYFLSRNWDDTLPAVTFIGLNPSTADATLDDPTIRRCVAFAKRWGGGAMWMVNLFAYRSTDPARLKTVVDPVGTENDKWIDFAVSQAKIVVAAWGNHGSLLARSTSIASRHGSKLKALEITQAGMPKHPLYVRGDVTPSDFIVEKAITTRPVSP